MYFHRQELQHKATPDAPDAVYARKLQEVLGGQYGEITVALQYQFQAWNMHIPGNTETSCSVSAPRRWGTSRCSRS